MTKHQPKKHLTQKTSKAKRTNLKANYGDATPEEVAKAVLTYRPPWKANPKRKPTRNRQP